MKQLTAVLFVLIFGALALGACGDPCEKSFRKFEKCALKELPERSHAEFKKGLNVTKDKWMSKCSKAKNEVKDCNKIDDCKKFEECVGKIK
ncbi:MAG: hypothetical protein ABI333_25035 [bacterium]